jgi:drug/metabolite transporter (DMT)-like permease
MSLAKGTEADVNIPLGSLYICVSALCFASAGIAAKSALHELTSVQMVFWRNATSLACFSLWIFGFERQTLSLFETRTPALHFTRSALSMCVLYCYFLAISRIPLAVAILFLSMSPIFVPAIALVVFGHRSRYTVWVGVVVAFAGVALILEPNLTDKTHDNDYIGILAGILAGAFAGGSTVTIWRLSETDSPRTQLSYFTAASFLMSAPAAIWTWRWPPLSTFVPIVGLGVATTFAQYFLSKACTVAPLDRINTWSYLSIVIAALASFAIWGEALEYAALGGILLVVFGAKLAAGVKKPRRLGKA